MQTHNFHLPMITKAATAPIPIKPNHMTFSPYVRPFSAKYRTPWSVELMKNCCFWWLKLVPTVLWNLGSFIFRHTFKQQQGYARTVHVLKFQQKSFDVKWIFQNMEIILIEHKKRITCSGDGIMQNIHNKAESGWLCTLLVMKYCFQFAKLYDKVGVFASQMGLGWGGKCWASKS